MEEKKITPSDTVKKYGIRPKKRLGQNFITDKNILNKFSTYLPDKDTPILEIGAGFGALTEILASGGNSIVAVEPDKSLIAPLSDLKKKYSNIEVLNESVLDMNFFDFFADRNFAVFGNLPYYITTKIIFHVLGYSHKIDYAVFTVQKEVADRLLSLPGNKNYGRLTVSVRLYAGVEKLFDIKKNSFYPVPDVDSSVVRLNFNKLPDIDTLMYERVVEVLFKKRRKTVLNNMAELAAGVSKDEIKSILQTLGIDYNLRPEELMLKDFISITDFLSGKK